MKTVLTLLILGSLSQLFAQGNVTGTWKTIDDNSGEARSHIEIYEESGLIFGKVVRLLDSEPDIVCEECKGAKKNKPILGMVILEKLQPYKDYYRKGSILDPENGNTYKCTIWVDENSPDQLKVRGIHWTGLYRTQTWHRIKDN